MPTFFSTCEKWCRTALNTTRNCRKTWVASAAGRAGEVVGRLGVVLFTWMSEHALALFQYGQHMAWWLPLLWTPLCTALVVWVTRRWAPGAAGIAAAFNTSLGGVMFAIEESCRDGPSSAAMV